MTKKKKEKKISKKLGIAIIVICSVLIVVLAVALLRAPKKGDNVADADAIASDSNVNDKADGSAEGLAIPEKDIDWKELKEENEDIYAWIYIPNTNIDYPILQHDTDNDYYLNHNVDGSSGYPGCIYSQVQYNGMDFTDKNTVLYGHNMKNGTMFADLHKFEDINFFDENRYVYIYMPDKALTYEIFGAYIFTDALIPEKYDFNSEQGFKDYLEMVFSVSGATFHNDTVNKMTFDDKLLTLSTCIPNQERFRWIVQGVLEEE